MDPVKQGIERSGVTHGRLESREGRKPDTYSRREECVDVGKT